MMNEREAYLKNSFLRLGISLSQHQTNQFLLYNDMLIEKNKVMNLTAITDFPDVVTKHFIDSTCIIMYKDISSCSHVLDLGTGAGFPGIPLAILYPDLSFTLADSLNKRVVFLNEVIHSLGLSHIETVHGRAEELGWNPAMRGRYDLVLSRAVAGLPCLCEYCLPFVKKGGLFAAYKSGNIEEEVKSAQRAIHELGAKLDREPVKYVLPGTDQERSLIFIKKTLDTPGRYPRRPGVPAKNPL